MGCSASSHEDNDEATTPPVSLEKRQASLPELAIGTENSMTPPPSKGAKAVSRQVSFNVEQGAEATRDVDARELDMHSSKSSPTSGQALQPSGLDPAALEQHLSPRGKNVLVRGVSAQNMPPRQLQRMSSVEKEVNSRAMARAPKAEAGRRWASFTPAPLVLTADARQRAHETLRLALQEHFLFRSFTTTQLDATVSAMRHRAVHAGHVVSSQGEKATHFFVCTLGGLEMSVRSADSDKPVLVAQMGPCGSFGSSALLGEGSEVKVTSTAVVDTEVFSLARDVFQHIRRARPTQATSDAVAALMRVPAFAAMPRAALDTMAKGMEVVNLPAGSALSDVDEHGDDLLMVVDKGIVMLERTDGTVPAAASLSTPSSSSAAHPSSALPTHSLLRTSAMLSRFIPHAAEHTVELAVASCVGCGRASDELLLACLFSSPHLPSAVSEVSEEQVRPQTTDGRRVAAPKFAQTMKIPQWPLPHMEGEEGTTSVDGRHADDCSTSSALPVGRQLQLLSSDSAGWKLTASQANAACIFRMSLRAACAAVLEAPSLLGSSPLPVRALLQSLPPFGSLSARDLDALSFTFSLATFQAGTELALEGKPAAMLHLVITGSAHIQRLVATGGADAQRHSASQAVCGSYFAGDVIGARSALGGWKSEPATIVVRIPMLTLAIDRAVVASALPPDIVTALLARTDELTISTSSAPAALVRFGGSHGFDGEPSSVLKIERILARGTFGVVASAVHASTGGCYAVKRIQQSAMVLPALQRQLLAERAALCAIAHPCVCRLFATHKNALALYLVMELCDGPQLYEAIQAEGGLEEGRLVACTSCIVAALGALHERGWIYRDIKAENLVFMASGHLKLVDLGLARHMPASGRCFTVVGTCEYMAPEVIKQASGYDAGADWWGLGCLVYEMRYTHTPWLLDEHGGFDVHMSDTAVSRRILDVDRPLEFPSAAPALSPALASLVHDLLEHQPARRLGGGWPGSAAVRAHALFVEVDWAAVDAGTNKMPPASGTTGTAMLTLPVAWRAGSSGTTSSFGVPVVPIDTGFGASVERRESSHEQHKREGEDGQDVDEVGDDEDDDTNLDPISAQLMRFLKEKQASETTALAVATNAPPPLSSRAEQRSASPKSKVSLSRSFDSSSSSSMEALRVDSFWDGPAYEDTADAWDRQF